ncbi:glycoside hydrolase [Cladorrhinum sp. PSN259]|nr:glycoside hydrolase [Cladorrhinum sp. PSN259]
MKLPSSLSYALAGTALLFHQAKAVDLSLNNEASIKQVASTIAYGLVKYYTGNNTGDTPGNLPDPYFWWEAGAMFGTLIDYWSLTGDETYNAITTQAMLHQAADTKDFMPLNQTRTLGNDDQGFWAMSAMSAAELRYPDPPEDKPQWLALAQAVFNQWASRWDETSCGGGLRWQVFRFNNGFNYKNSISNGCFFNLASRLARFTGNQTYAVWAVKIFEWEEKMDLITDDYDVVDGTNVDVTTNQCGRRDEIQWSYNAGIYLHGSAVMYNITKDALWKRRLDGLLQATIRTFYPNNTANGIMVEQFCEDRGFCDIDQRSFKGYLTRWMARATQLAPHTYDTIHPLLESSAAAAAKACSGSPAAAEFRGIPGTACGFKWTTGGFDGWVGVGEQMNALSAVASMLVDRTAAPVTADTGGTSKGNPAGGYGSERTDRGGHVLKPITQGEKAAAGILTGAMLMGVIGGVTFVML